MRIVPLLLAIMARFGSLVDASVFFVFPWASLLEGKQLLYADLGPCLARKPESKPLFLVMLFSGSGVLNSFPHQGAWKSWP